MLNFACPAELLEPLVPRGTELDAHAGVPQVSLVGFMFRDTRVLGRAGAVPPDLRGGQPPLLRAPRRRRRGAPRGRLRAGARAAVGDRDRGAGALPGAVSSRPDVASGRLRRRADPDRRGGRVPLERLRQPVPDALRGERTGGGRSSRVRRRSSSPSTTGATRRSATEARSSTAWSIRRWRVHPVGERLVEGDLSALYGPAFGEVLSAAPTSAFVATGSPIIVRRGRRLPV